MYLFSCSIGLTVALSLSLSLSPSVLITSLSVRGKPLSLSCVLCMCGIKLFLGEGDCSNFPFNLSIVLNEECVVGSGYAESWCKVIVLCCQYFRVGIISISLFYFTKQFLCFAFANIISLCNFCFVLFVCCLFICMVVVC